MVELVLASTSPARKRLLDAAGLRFLTLNPGVDEERLVNQHKPQTAEATVSLLAEAKARAGLANWGLLARDQISLVLGCDSALEIEGQTHGKPLLPEVARQRWEQLRGSEGYLVTGHCLIDSSSEAMLTRVSKTLVKFAETSNEEIETYVATGEPLQVAGAFTIDGIGGAFIREIIGDYHAVVGLSLSTLRMMVTDLGYSYTALWKDQQSGQ